MSMYATPNVVLVLSEAGERIHVAWCKKDEPSRQSIDSRKGGRVVSYVSPFPVAGGLLV